MDLHKETREWRALIKATNRNRPLAFVDYCKVIIQMQASGGINSAEAAKSICAAIQFDDLYEVPELSEIIDIACDLELPEPHRFSNESESNRWKKIRHLLEQFENEVMKKTGR